MDDLEGEFSSKRDDCLFTEKARRFADRGCSILVAGLVPQSRREYLCLYPFAETSTETESILLFGSFGRNDRAIRDPINRYDLESESVYAIITDSSTKPAAPMESSERVSYVPDELDAFENAVCQTITRLKRDPDSYSLDDLYVFLDSLWPVLRRYETQRVERFLEVINQVAIGTESVVFVNLPVAYDSSVVGHLKPYFDVHIDLRQDDEAVVQQRWNLLISGHQTDWIPLGSDYAFIE